MVSMNNIVVRDPDILGGTPVFRGTRVPLQTLFDYLEGGDTLEGFLQGFPTVSRDMAIAALEDGSLRRSCRTKEWRSSLRSRNRTIRRITDR